MCMHVAFKSVYVYLLDLIYLSIKPSINQSIYLSTYLPSTYLPIISIYPSISVYLPYLYTHVSSMDFGACRLRRSCTLKCNASTAGRAPDAWYVWRTAAMKGSTGAQLCSGLSRSCWAWAQGGLRVRVLQCHREQGFFSSHQKQGC